MFFYFSSMHKVIMVSKTVERVQELSGTIKQFETSTAMTQNHK